jgi:hypothetical protein
MNATIRDVLTNILTAMGKPDSAVMGGVRHGLTTVGGILVSSGYLDDSGASQLIGSTMILAGVVWSIAAKYIVTHWLQVATLAPSITTRPELAAIVANMPSGAPTTATVAVAVEAAKRDKA